MSVVVFLHNTEEKTIYAACDGVTVSGSFIVNKDNLKISKEKNCIAGTAGSTLGGLYFRRALCKKFSKFLEKYTPKTKEANFWEDVGKFFITNEKVGKIISKFKAGSDGDVSIMFGCKQGIFTLEVPNLSLGVCHRPYHSIGSGKYVAQGAMHVLFNKVLNEEEDIASDEIVEAAVKTAIEHVTSVQGDVKIVEFDYT